MKKIDFETKKLFPLWNPFSQNFGEGYRMLTGEERLSIMVSDQDISIADEICLKYEKYRLNLNEICALIHYSRFENHYSEHELSKILRKPISKEKRKENNRITGLLVNTNKGTIKLDDPYIIELITQRYEKRYASGRKLELHLVRMLNYFEYSTRIATKPRNIVIGMICFHCGLYKRKPLKSKEEVMIDPKISAKSWEEYLHNNVKTWIKPFTVDFEITSKKSNNSEPRKPFK